MVFKKTWPGQR